MGRISDASGVAQAAAVKNETNDEANTAIRIGQQLQDLWDSKAHKDVTDGLQTSITNLTVNKEPISVANAYADVSGTQNFPNPYLKTYYAWFENVEGNTNIVLPNALPPHGAYIQICVFACNGHTLKLQSLHTSIGFEVSDGFELRITAVGSNEFTMQLPNNTTDKVIISMIYQEGWYVNAAVYKKPVVS
ncbi:hypothetical protein AD998_07505 [bacterium 336/3]|nr:hypothetical protein AD998_07505 [bacterium 336/3]